LDNFFKIRAEKQEHIINAAFKAFGKQGYKKASVADIAEAAGITKGMITYYFGSKKNLYLYLAELGNLRLIRATMENIPPGITDFFGKIKRVMDIQISAVKEHPALISFVNSIFYETDPEVADIIEELFTTELTQFDEYMLDESGFSQFKPGFDPKILCKFIVWANNGFLDELFECSDQNRDALVAEFYQCLDLMQECFYKA